MVKKFSNLGINALCFFFIIQNCENFIKKGSQDQPKIQIQGPVVLLPSRRTY